LKAAKSRHETQHSDIHQNGTQHDETQHNYSQHNNKKMRHSANFQQKTFVFNEEKCIFKTPQKKFLKVILFFEMTLFILLKKVVVLTFSEQLSISLFL
jgi:hypothetical protein